MQSSSDTVSSVLLDHSYARPLKECKLSVNRIEHAYAHPPTVYLRNKDSSNAASPVDASIVIVKTPMESATASVVTVQCPIESANAAVAIVESPVESPNASVVTVESSLPLSATITDHLNPCCSNTNEQGNTFTQKAKTVKQENLHIECPHCFIVLYKKNLKSHIQRKHGPPKDITAEHHHQSILIDQDRGLYAVKKNFNAISLPVHVQRKTWGEEQATRCEVEDCRQYHQLCLRSGLAHSMCDHIRSIDYCMETATEEQPQLEVLEEMLINKLFGEAKAAACRKRHKEAEEAQSPLCAMVDFDSSKTKLCFSVHEPHLHYYSSLGRVIVTYNIEKKLWHCPCTKAYLSCQHKSISKWHLYQNRRDLFMAPFLTSSTHPESDPHNTEMERCIRYIYENKKLPTTLPKEITSFRVKTDYPSQLIPTEKTCKMCPGNPELEEAVQITDNARIVGMDGVVQNISTYNRKCPQCNMMYRYQEWEDGLHNFNDHLILTLRLCMYFRHNVQHHACVSRVIAPLEALYQTKFPNAEKIFNAYCHFEALCNTQYQYSCIKCGFYPPVVVMEHHRKGVFKYEVSELQQMDDDFIGEQNIEAFWESVSLHMISQGFFETPSQNPFVVKPTYRNWAPWIGRDTRKSGAALNTEFKKASLESNPGQLQLELTDLTEDRLEELLDQDVATIRQLCKSYNTNTRGSRMELIARLRREIRRRQGNDDVFQSLWGTSGGCSVIMCTHGIVYSLKFNLHRAEISRDFTDLLLSWKHFPNVCIYASGPELVAHANRRIPDDPPFRPFEGKLAEPTEENCEGAVDGTFKVPLPWLLDRLEHPEPNGHPLTGSSQHYVLHDDFQKAFSKEPEDALRRITVVPEIHATLDSEITDQLLAFLRSNNYFLNHMGPSGHIFLMRNIIEHRNNIQNAELFRRQFT